MKVKGQIKECIPSSTPDHPVKHTRTHKHTFHKLALFIHRKPKWYCPLHLWLLFRESSSVIYLNGQPNFSASIKLKHPWKYQQLYYFTHGRFKTWDLHKYLYVSPAWSESITQSDSSQIWPTLNSHFSPLWSNLRFIGHVDGAGMMTCNRGWQCEQRLEVCRQGYSIIDRDDLTYIDHDIATHLLCM